MIVRRHLKSVERISDQISPEETIAEKGCVTSKNSVRLIKPNHGIVVDRSTKVQYCGMAEFWHKKLRADI